MTLTSNLVVGLYLLSAASCVAPGQGHSGQCDVTSIDVLFERPLDYHGQMFCGVGYLYSGDEFTGIYPRVITDESERFEIAILLEADIVRRHCL